MAQLAVAEGERQDNQKAAEQLRAELEIARAEQQRAADSERYFKGLADRWSHSGRALWA